MKLRVNPKILNINDRNISFILWFFLTQIFILAIVFLLIFTFRSELPAPSISSSISFNEKARWLRKYGISQNSCDILVIGSSIGLNNIDTEAVTKALRNKSIINVSSWGLALPDSAKLLSILAPLCKPKLIIYVAYHTDFKGQPDKTINWAVFSSYLNGRSELITYISSPKIYFYITTFFWLRNIRIKKNSIYASLDFTKTGSVMLNSEYFEVDQNRWDGWNINNGDNILNASDVQLGLKSLSLIEEIAKQHGARLMAIKTPLRKKYDGSATNLLSDLWYKVEQSVLNAGGIFINVGLHSKFDDSFFADFVHLNKDGAKNVSDIITQDIFLAIQ